jgi:hypothetical protein
VRIPQEAAVIEFLIITGVLVLIILILVIVVRRRRGKDPNRLRLADVGTIIDRSVRSYRLHLVPMLIVSALLVPLGNFSNYAGNQVVVMADLILMAAGNYNSPLTALLGLITLLGTLGLGKTLLSCGVVRMLQHSQEGTPMRLSAALPHGRWGAVAGLAALMIIPSALLMYLGLIGGLVWLFFALAPVVMFYEELGPVSACKRSYRLIRKNYSPLLNTLVPLWLIGWLLVGTLLYGGLFALGLLVDIPPTLSAGLMVLFWLVGSIFVAPLVTLGAVQYYHYVREREQPAVEAVTMERLQEALDASARTQAPLA